MKFQINAKFDPSESLVDRDDILNFEIKFPQRHFDCSVDNEKNRRGENYSPTEWILFGELSKKKKQMNNRMKTEIVFVRE